ncbi:MAG TPA: hypothetical protein VFL76_10530 [Edaphocola sp.]|nr:hypothetical protein [Edaphocola sp.]
MKFTITLVAFTIVISGLFSCQIGSPNGNEKSPGKILSAQGIPETEKQYFISADSANRMIRSYLLSVGDSNGNTNDENIQSLILNADALRCYLKDSSIKHVKVMLAHTLKYINDGHYGEPAGYAPGAFTIIISGYNAEGNYVLAPGNLVPDHSKPCPTLCSMIGTSASPLLPVSDNP